MGDIEFFSSAIENAEDRDTTNDLETPEYKMLADTLDHLEQEDYLKRFIDETDYDTFQDKCQTYEQEKQSS